MTRPISFKHHIRGCFLIFLATLAVGTAFAAGGGQEPATLSFSQARTFASGGYIAQGVAIADLNGDGKPDIVVSSWWLPESLQGMVAVLLRNSSGGFAPPTPYKTGGAPNYSVVVADVNGDGKPDIIVSSCAPSSSTCDSADGVVSVLLGEGNGTFRPALSYDAGAFHTAVVAVADVNGDGKPDLLVANYYGEANGDGTVAVLLGSGDGTFQPAVLYDSGAQNANDVTAADVNGDGVLDLLVVNRCDSCAGGGVLGVLLGNGNGTFQPAVTYPTGGYNSAWISAADLNGDGTPDVMVSNLNLGMAEGTLSVLVGTGSGTFGSPVTYDSGGYGAAESVLADVNLDGKPDIVVANCGPVGECGTGVIGVLLGQGNGTFEPVMTFNSGAYNATTVAVGKLNTDGPPDLAVGNQCDPDSCTQGSVTLLLNKSSK